MYTISIRRRCSRTAGICVHGNGNALQLKQPSLWFFVWFWLWPTTKYIHPNEKWNVCVSCCVVWGVERPKDADGEEEKPIIRLSSLYRALRVPFHCEPGAHATSSRNQYDGIIWFLCRVAHSSFPYQIKIVILFRNVFGRSSAVGSWQKHTHTHTHARCTNK